MIVEFFLPSAPNTYDTLVGYEIFFCALIVVFWPIQRPFCGAIDV